MTKPNETEIIGRIRAILDEPVGCQCSLREWCEKCSQHSEYSKLRMRILAEIEGPKPPPDYGATLSISISDLRKEKP